MPKRSLHAFRFTSNKPDTCHMEKAGEVNRLIKNQA
jgi:hypothetical protein